MQLLINMLKIQFTICLLILGVCQVFSQDFGNRGEEYLLLQSLLGVAVLNGQFPLFQNLISILFGPFLWSVGIFEPCMRVS
mgnify:CR=1 FL=1